MTIAFVAVMEVCCLDLLSKKNLPFSYTGCIYLTVSTYEHLQILIQTCSSWTSPCQQLKMVKVLGPVYFPLIVGIL
jgi:hypothetical protein